MLGEWGNRETFMFIVYRKYVEEKEEREGGRGREGKGGREGRREGEKDQGKEEEIRERGGK